MGEFNGEREREKRMNFKCDVFGLKGEKRNSNERVITLYSKLTTLQISHLWWEIKIYLGGIFSQLLFPLLLSKH